MPRRGKKETPVTISISDPSGNNNRPTGNYQSFRNILVVPDMKSVLMIYWLKMMIACSFGRRNHLSKYRFWGEVISTRSHVVASFLARGYISCDCVRTKAMTTYVILSPRNSILSQVYRIVCASLLICSNSFGIQKNASDFLVLSLECIANTSWYFLYSAMYG